MDRRNVLALLAGTTLAQLSIHHASAQQDDPVSQAHIDWVARILARMITIEPGMTRERLLTVFAEEGGLSTTEQRTYVSKDCPLFKVNVTFHPVLPTYDQEGRMTANEDGRDTILTISQPFVAYEVLD